MALGTYVYAYTPNVPTGATSQNPASYQPGFGDLWVDTIQIVIPPGHRGLTGIQITNGGTPILPWGQGTGYLIGDDDKLSYDIGCELDSSLSINAYNTDVFRHNFYLRFIGLPMNLYNARGGPTVTTIVPVTAS